MRTDGKTALLIADDDPQIRQLLQVAAERAGCFALIASAANGEEALRWLQQAEPAELPELIVSDLWMPRMTGVDLLHALKKDERFRTIPVAIVTSSSEVQDRENAIAAGAATFMRKPLGLDALTRVLVQFRQQCCETAGVR